MALIRRPDGYPRVFNLEIDSGTTIKKLLKNIGFSLQEIRVLQTFVTQGDIDENERVSAKYELQDNDRIFVTIPVGGGIAVSRS